MVIARADFRVQNIPHRVELEKQRSVTRYAVKVDGVTHCVIPAQGLGFKKRFALFDGYCTVSLIRLGGLYTRYRITMQQQSHTVAA